MIGAGRGFRAALLLAGAAAVAAMAWWLFAAKPASADAAAAATPILSHDGVRIVVPDRSPLRQSLRVLVLSESIVAVPLSLPAAVEADPARLFKALPPVTGRITKLVKALGDRVAVGDVLFVLDSADVAQAVSDAEKARAALRLAGAARERQHALGDSGIATKRDIEQADNDFQQAVSEAARADARIASLGVGRRVAVEGRSLVVRSPITGFVIDLDTASGAFWNDLTAPVMTVTDLSRVFVTASADETDVGKVFVGQEAGVVFDAYPGDPLAARVHDIGHVLDADTRRVKVRMAFDNRDGRLRPGMFANATFVGKPHRGLLVPAAAVVQSGFESRVFVEVAPWTFEPRVVRLGPRVGDELEIVGGLAANERIVVRDGVLLDD